jgi:putative ABC transport system substrate-binding protein
MARNTILVLLAALTLVSIDPAQAQQQSKTARIGWLSTRPASWPGGGSDVIRRELHELGYAEGKNIVFQYHHTEGNLERLPELAADLVRLKVNVHLAYSTPARRACRRKR